MLRFLGRLLLAIPLWLALLWAAAALWFDGPDSRPLAALLSGFVVLLALAALLRLARAIFRLGVLVLVLVAVLAWWLSLAPSNDRPWLPDVARVATAEFDGDHVTIHNVRNFSYRSENDYDERWETRRYDLSAITGVDLFLVYWGSPAIAHTIASWDFETGPPLAISIETRKERGEAYSAVKGFFRQYELYYVVADERDVVALRTNHRGEDVYLYHLAASPERARAILLKYLEAINRLAKEPAWYNAATHNCTTAIRAHVQEVARSPWDWRILVNGYLDRMGYERGSINTSLPFEELRARSYINARALAADAAADFSQRIRAGLPERPKR